MHTDCGKTTNAGSKVVFTQPVIGENLKACMNIGLACMSHKKQIVTSKDSPVISKYKYSSLNKLSHQ